MNKWTEGDINATQERINWQAQNIDEQTKALLKRDGDVFLHQSMSTPCIDIIESCKGTGFISKSGKAYLDFHGNNLHQAGFANEEVVAAIQKQLDALSFCTRRFANQKAIELAEKLVALTDNTLQRVLFAPGATLAMGMALKLARISSGKHKTLSMWDSFHGASLDALSIGGEDVFRGGLGALLPGCEHVFPFNSYRCFLGECTDCGLKCVKYIEYVLERESDIGAIIMETVRNTDVQIPSEPFYLEIRRLCDKHNVLLILDETATCFGRTGKWFAYQNYEIVPDMVVMGKAMGGGIIPFAALLAKEELNVAANTSIGHYTHEKSPVASAAALASIRYIENNMLLEKAEEDGKYFRSLLETHCGPLACVGDIRGIGLLSAIELVMNRETREKNVQLAERVMYDCLTDGLSFKVSQGNVLTLSPALTITRQELEFAARTIADNIKKYDE